MLVVANRLAVHPDYDQEFETLFAEQSAAMQAVPGFISYQLLRPLNDEPYIVQTVWESPDDYEAWTESDSFKATHSRSRSLPKEAYTAPPILEFHTIIDITASE